jgi:flagellar capping protein FliD
MLTGDRLRDLNSEIEKQITALERAMASGALRVEAPDAATITYRDYNEMQRAMSGLRRRQSALNEQALGVRQTRQIVTTSRSGW